MARPELYARLKTALGGCVFGIKEFSDWPTVPQLYVKGEFVGGLDIMMEMFESGELKQLIAGNAQEAGT